MKKFLILLSISGLFLATTSCDEDLLEPFTPGALTEDIAVTNVTQLGQLMNSAYGLLFDREEAVFTSVFTDEASIGFANGGQGRNEEFIFFLNSGTAGPTKIWNNNYFALSRANRVIKFADELYTNASTADQALITHIKAEALTMRALSHIKILAYFSPDPKNDGALAGILANRVIETGEALPRSTNGEFYTQIHADLDAAITLFNSVPAAYTGQAKTYYGNAIVAKALKARAYALKGDYTNAEVYANDVINTSGITLATPSQYKSLFWSDSEPANTEVIFRSKRTGAQNSQGDVFDSQGRYVRGGNMHNGWCSVRPNLNGSPFYEVSRGLFNVLNPTNVAPGTAGANWSNLDVRLHTMCSATSVVDPNYMVSPSYSGTDRLVLQKYGGMQNSSGNPWASTATNGNNNDFKVIRLSEMYMIRAEARVAAGDLAGAAAAVEAVRDARNPVNQPTPSYANATAAWADILLERRLEFAFEGHRFIDLKRLASLAGVTALDRHPADYADTPGGNPANLSMTSYKWALPIPFSEINANGSIQQNPGY